jgi:alpha-D-ribose 1-methylphosphonate 5-phosphate C-P lyase
VIDVVGFVKEDKQRSSKNRIKLRGRNLPVIGGWGTGQVRARISANVAEAEKRDFAVPSSTKLVVYDVEDGKSQPEQVELLVP